MKLDYIYKRNIDGKVQLWQREIDGDKYRTLTAKADLLEDGSLEIGKISESKWKTAKAKNTGKANATTGEYQALLECESDYTKKLKTGYAKNLIDIDNVFFNEPMLAHPFEKYKKGLPERVYTQYKLDGVRAIITKKDIRTRENDIIISCPHLSENLKPFFDKYPDAILDGELYNHKFKDDFNAIISLVRKSADFTPEDYITCAGLIEYHVYDIFSKENYPDRWKFLADNLIDIPMVEIVPIHIITPSLIDDTLEKVLELGYEGLMVRLPDYGYEAGKRSWSLLKYKIFDTNEFRIKDILAGVGNRSDIAGSVVCYLPDGREFSGGIKGSWEYAEKLLREKEKYIGGQGTIRHFKYTQYGIPRFPVLIEVYEKRRNM